MKYIEYVEAFAALYLLYIGSAMNTHNFKSQVVFNWIPCVLSLLFLISSLRAFGVI